MMDKDGIFPRRDLFTNGDVDAWADEFHMLFYVLDMSPLQIAQINYGLDPDHPEAWAACIWAHEINRQFPFFSTRVHLEAVRRRHGKRP